MSKRRGKHKKLSINIDGGFYDLRTLREELGDSVAGLSDAEAMAFIDENLKEKAKLTREQRAKLDDSPDINTYDDTVYKNMADNMRAKAEKEEQERRRLAMELENEKNKKRSIDICDLSSLSLAQRRLRDELELERLRRLNRDPWSSNASLDNFLIKERIKRDVKEELLEEKNRAKRKKELDKLWNTGSTRKRSKSRSKHRSKSKNKSKSSTRKGKK